MIKTNNNNEANRGIMYSKCGNHDATYSTFFKKKTRWRATIVKQLPTKMPVIKTWQTRCSEKSFVFCCFNTCLCGAGVSHRLKASHGPNAHERWPLKLQWVGSELEASFPVFHYPRGAHQNSLSSLTDHKTWRLVTVGNVQMFLVTLTMALQDSNVSVCCDSVIMSQQEQQQDHETKESWWNSFSMLLFKLNLHEGFFATCFTDVMWWKFEIGGGYFSTLNEKELKDAFIRKGKNPEVTVKKMFFNSVLMKSTVNLFTC